MSAVSPKVGLVGEGASRWSLCHGLGRMVNNLTYMDPPALSRGSREEKHVSGQMQSYIRIWTPPDLQAEHESCVRASCVRIFDLLWGRDPRVLMSYAPLLLIGLAASSASRHRRAPDIGRFGKGRSNLLRISHLSSLRGKICQFSHGCGAHAS